MLRQVWGTVCPSVVFSGRTLKAKAGGQGPEHQSTRFTFSASNVCFWSLAGSQTSKVFCLPLPPRKWISSVQCSSVAQLCLTLCDPMNHCTPGLPVSHQLPEFTQTHAPRVGDAIQPSHPLSSPSPPAPNTSQHQVLFKWVNSSQEND